MSKTSLLILITLGILNNSCLILALSGLAAAKAVSSLSLEGSENYYITPYEDLPFNLVVKGYEVSANLDYGVFTNL